MSGRGIRSTAGRFISAPAVGPLQGPIPKVLIGSTPPSPLATVGSSVNSSPHKQPLVPSNHRTVVEFSSQPARSLPAQQLVSNSAQEPSKTDEIKAKLRAWHSRVKIGKPDINEPSKENSSLSKILLQPSSASAPSAPILISSAVKPHLQSVPLVRGPSHKTGSSGQYNDPPTVTTSYTSRTVGGVSTGVAHNDLLVLPHQQKVTVGVIEDGQVSTGKQNQEASSFSTLPSAPNFSGPLSLSEILKRKKGTKNGEPKTKRPVTRVSNAVTAYSQEKKSAHQLTRVPSAQSLDTPHPKSSITSENPNDQLAINSSGIETQNLRSSTHNLLQVQKSLHIQSPQNHTNSQIFSSSSKQHLVPQVNQKSQRVQDFPKEDLHKLNVSPPCPNNIKQSLSLPLEAVPEYNETVHMKDKPCFSPKSQMLQHVNNNFQPVSNLLPDIPLKILPSQEDSLKDNDMHQSDHHVTSEHNHINRVTLQLQKNVAGNELDLHDTEIDLKSSSLYISQANSNISESLNPVSVEEQQCKSLAKDSLQHDILSDLSSSITKQLSQNIITSHKLHTPSICSTVPDHLKQTVASLETPLLPQAFNEKETVSPTVSMSIVGTENVLKQQDFISKSQKDLVSIRSMTLLSHEVPQKNIMTDLGTNHPVQVSQVPSSIQTLQVQHSDASPTITQDSSLIINSNNFSDLEKQTLQQQLQLEKKEFLSHDASPHHQLTSFGLHQESFSSNIPLIKSSVLDSQRAPIQNVSEQFGLSSAEPPSSLFKYGKNTSSFEQHVFNITPQGLETGKILHTVQEANNLNVPLLTNLSVIPSGDKVDSIIVDNMISQQGVQVNETFQYIKNNNSFPVMSIDLNSTNNKQILSHTSLLNSTRYTVGDESDKEMSQSFPISHLIDHNTDESKLTTDVKPLEVISTHTRDVSGRKRLKVHSDLTPKDLGSTHTHSPNNNSYIVQHLLKHDEQANMTADVLHFIYSTIIETESSVENDMADINEENNYIIPWIQSLSPVGCSSESVHQGSNHISLTTRCAIAFKLLSHIRQHQTLLLGDKNALPNLNSHNVLFTAIESRKQQILSNSVIPDTNELESVLTYLKNCTTALQSLQNELGDSVDCYVVHRKN